MTDPGAVAATAAENVFVALESMLRSSGRFVTVNRHEVKNAPPTQLTAEIWADRAEPAPVMSGLAVGSIIVTFKVRIGMGMLTEPQDAIDPAVIAAVVDLMARLHLNVSLGAGVELDAHGINGAGLFAQAGYVNRSGGLYRVMDVMIPVIVPDVFPQAR